MNTFLHLVAQSLLQRYGTNLSRLTLVFPGKRAVLFFNQALTELSDRPVWSPRCVTISELFHEASPYTPCDPVESVCRLHRVYAQIVDEPQTLDQFYGWGEVLLADFDDVDKHLADARQLFTNIRDIKALEDNSYITPEQEAALRSFFSDFSVEGNSMVKERFLALWNRMAQIYDELNASMRRDGLLYEGALQRDVVETLRRNRFAADEGQSPAPDRFDSDTTYVIVGFNVLNDVEQALFDELQHRRQALFFWDYDVFYADPTGRERHEAGYFIRQNIERYGNELPPECFCNMTQPKELTIVAASSENAQARYLPQWLHENLTATENRTAVVLCNEQLLQPVLHAIPEQVKALNVTMGYALTDTPVSSFVSVLLTLQTDGFDASHRRFRLSALRAVKNHPFSRLVDEALWHRHVEGPRELLLYLLDLLTTLGKCFAATQPADGETPTEAQQQALMQNTLYAEAIFVAYTCINRLANLMTGDRPLLDVNAFTLRRLVNAMLLSQSVPFHGEPAVGLQVMGVLETRSLDFDHLIMLSVGEGYLPKSVADTSFIPYHLKEAFGLTTLRHKIAVYAYYFYRLIQRASRVTFVYNESNAGLRQNEISRFLRQLEAETEFPIRHVRLQAASDVHPVPEISVPKSREVMHALARRFDCTGLSDEERKYKVLSPSALNRYTSCPLQFYYRYVEGLKVDEHSDDDFDAIRFGDVFHRAAELLYRHLTEKNPVVRGEDIDAMLEMGGQRMEAFVHQAFRDKYFEGRAEEYTGILTIAYRVVLTYLHQLLRHDRRLTPIRILGVELPQTEVFHVEAAGRTLELEVGGIIDRLDQVSDSNSTDGRVVRVVDYKTGGQLESVQSLEALFSNTGQSAHYYFQATLYATIVEAQRHQAVAPCLFFVHKSGSDDYSPVITLAKHTVADIREPLSPGDEPLNVAFRKRLVALLDEVFDDKVPFAQTKNPKACENCDFRMICGR